MLSWPGNIRVVVCTTPTDMRKQVYGLHGCFGSREVGERTEVILTVIRWAAGHSLVVSGYLLDGSPKLAART